jgi:hypothetical protein
VLPTGKPEGVAVFTKPELGGVGALIAVELGTIEVAGGVLLIAVELGTIEVAGGVLLIAVELGTIEVAGGVLLAAMEVGAVEAAWAADVPMRPSPISPALTRLPSRTTTERGPILVA